MGAAPMSPQAALAAASWIFWHVPAVLPLAVGMQTRPMLFSQLGPVLRVVSQAALSIVTDVSHVPIFMVMTSSPTQSSPPAHGCTPVRHAASSAANAVHFPVVTPAGVGHARSRPQSA